MKNIKWSTLIIINLIAVIVVLLTLPGENEIKNVGSNYQNEQHIIYNDSIIKSQTRAIIQLDELLKNTK